MTTTATMRHLSAIGSGPALAVFSWLKAAGQPVRQIWIESMTELSDKTVQRALKKLIELQYVVEVQEGYAVATAHQGVLGDVLAALPAEHDGNSVSASLEGPQDGDTTAAEGANGVDDGNSVSSSYGGGVGLSNLISESNISINHHQHHSGDDGISVTAASLPAGDPNRGRARLALLQLENMWPKPAEAVLRELDPEHGLRDVLGWIAYAVHPGNGVVKPAPIVLGHLRRHEQPGRPWVPPQICATCLLAEGFCQCAEPAWHCPLDYDALAFEPPPTWNADAWLANRWRCEVCGGHPCICDPEGSET